MIHTVKGFDKVNKAEIDVFLELSCFLDDSADVGKDWREEEKGTTEDKMVGRHHQLNGGEFE